MSSVHVTSAAAVTTGTGSVTVSSGDSSTSPERSASAWAPRAMSVTSDPAWKRRAPTSPPMAPAPKTTKRMPHSATRPRAKLWAWPS